MMWSYPSLRAVVAALALAPTTMALWDINSAAAARKNNAEPAAEGVIPGRYILEMGDKGSTTKRSIEARAEAVKRDIADLGYDFEVKLDYTKISKRFEGISIQIVNDKESTEEELKDLPGVKDVYPVHAVTLDDKIEITADSKGKWNPHISTRVDELHGRDIKGNGQTVCVIDTGVDKDHPALAGKVVGGKNLFEKDKAGDFSDCEGHGTFVSGVIIGQNKDFVGVAPEAKVFMYKIFGCDGSTSTDLMMAGLQTADADGCDIISMSVGSDIGYYRSITSRLASEIAKSRLVVIAAGNSGEFGTYYASSPAAGRDVVSVGSINARQLMSWPATIVSSSGEKLDITYVTQNGEKYMDKLSAPLKFDADGDSCNPTLYGNEGEGVLIKNGICGDKGSFNRMSSQGFNYHILFDSYNQGVFYPSEAVNDYPQMLLFALTKASVGEWGAAQHAAGHTMTLEIEADANTGTEPFDKPASGQMSAFTSWGPTFENDFYPLISAPGGVVYSTHPNNRYAVGSGTSFSCPYVAGVAALYYASVGKDREAFKKRMTSTAALMPAFDTELAGSHDGSTSLIQQGAGMIDAAKIFDHKSQLLSAPAISLNDTDNRVSTHTIRIKNNGQTAVVYKISHVAAVTVQSRDQWWYPNVYYPPVLAGVEGSIEAPSSLSLQPGETKDVSVTINAPAGAKGGEIFSGKIVFAADEINEIVSVPYMGTQVSTYNWTPLEGTPLVFRYDSNDGYLYPVNWKDQPYHPDQMESPEIYFALRYGTEELSLDLVGPDWKKEDWKYPLQAGSKSGDWMGALRSQPDVFGNYGNYPVRHAKRFSNVGQHKFQSYANGTKIVSGKYRVLSRTLRMFGDATKMEDWQLNLSDPFWIQLGDEPIPGYGTTTTAATAEPTTETSATGSATASTTEERSAESTATKETGTESSTAAQTTTQATATAGSATTGSSATGSSATGSSATGSATSGSASTGTAATTLVTKSSETGAATTSAAETKSSPASNPVTTKSATRGRCKPHRPTTLISVSSGSPTVASTASEASVVSSAPGTSAAATSAATDSVAETTLSTSPASASTTGTDATTIGSDATTATDATTVSSDAATVTSGSATTSSDATTIASSETAEVTSEAATTEATSVEATSTVASDLETTTAAPGITTTLKSTAEPTGVANLFVDIDLQKQGSQTRNIADSNDWLELHVRMHIPTRLREGSVASFTLPDEIGEVASGMWGQTSGGLVAKLDFDATTRVYSVKFESWVDWHSNIDGDFYLWCRFKPEFQKTMEAGTYNVEIKTLGKTFTPQIHLAAIDRSRVYEGISAGKIGNEEVYNFNVEVPGSVGPWKSVSFVSNQFEYDGYFCDAVKAVIGTEFDKANRIVKSRDVTKDAVWRCEVKAMRAKYGEIGKDEVLQLQVPMMQGYKQWSSVTMQYTLDIEMPDGTVNQIIRAPTYEKNARSRPDNFFTQGDRDTEGPIQG